MQKTRTLARVLLALFLIIAGIGHFIIPEFYLRMMPPYLPAPYSLIYISAVAEIALGVCALIPKLQPIAKYGIILLLLAIFPANIHMALNPHLFPEFSSIGLLLRLPFQAIFILWVIFSLPNTPLILAHK